MRPAVVQLLELGPLPTEDDDDLPFEESVALLEKYGALLDGLECPATDEEALALLGYSIPRLVIPASD